MLKSLENNLEKYKDEKVQEAQEVKNAQSVFKPDAQSVFKPTSAIKLDDISEDDKFFDDFFDD